VDSERMTLDKFTTPNSGQTFNPANPHGGTPRDGEEQDPFPLQRGTSCRWFGSLSLEDAPVARLRWHR